MKTYELITVVVSSCIIGYTVRTITTLPEQTETKYDNCIEDDCMHIVWNDDDESIPTVGSLVEVQYIDAGCVYIGPKE